ncbi:MAG: class I SAM-dependent methyltransferase [Planctomycetota bacterium]
MSSPVAFTGSVPRTYHTYLGPMIFDDYAHDMARRLAVREGERVLELACGTGIVTREIVKTLPKSAKLLATDLNQAMLDVAKVEVADDYRVTYQAVDACELPFGDGSFEAIACQYGVMFFPDKVKAMAAAKRVLAPGGRYIFNVWDSLEHNPIPRAVHETLAAMFPVNPIPFLAKTPYGYSDRAEIERVVQAGGFGKCMTETVGFPCTAPTAQDAAKAWCEGTPILAALAERGVSDPTPVRQAVAKVLGEKFGERPCKSTMRAVVVTAG